MSTPNTSGTTSTLILNKLCTAIGSRHAASEILQKVSEAGSWGGYPHEVTGEEIGRALFRICLNSREDNPLAGIISGWRTAQSERATQG